MVPNLATRRSGLIGQNRCGVLQSLKAPGPRQEVLDSHPLAAPARMASEIWRTHSHETFWAPEYQVFTARSIFDKIRLAHKMQGHSGPQLLQLLTVDGEGAGTGGQGHATHQAALTGFSQPVPELRGSFACSSRGYGHFFLHPELGPLDRKELPPKDSVHEIPKLICMGWTSWALLLE